MSSYGTIDAEKHNTQSGLVTELEPIESTSISDFSFLERQKAQICTKGPAKLVGGWDLTSNDIN